MKVVPVIVVEVVGCAADVFFSSACCVLTVVAWWALGYCYCCSSWLDVKGREFVFLLVVRA